MRKKILKHLSNQNNLNLKINQKKNKKLMIRKNTLMKNHRYLKDLNFIWKYFLKEIIKMTFLQRLSNSLVVRLSKHYRIPCPHIFCGPMEM